VFERSAPTAKCPNWRHRNAVIHANGTQTRNARTFRRYRCKPRDGRTHYFAILIEGPTRTPTTWQPPPPCPKHPGGKVVRDGLYARGSEKPRQRYRCHPADGSKRHRFTPALPRAYKGHGFDEPCDTCEETPGIHHGDQVAARRHGWSSRTVARGLMRLARGETYGETAAWALRRSRAPRTRRPASPTTSKRPATAAANRRWHIAADWVDCYSPAIWEPLEAAMRAKAQAERARIDAALAVGGPLERPIIWVADEHSIHGRSDELFVVLVVAECEWQEGVEQPVLRLRVARAMPDRTAASWLLVFDEIAGDHGEGPIWPDFLVSDASWSITKAADVAFGGRTRWVPSIWHLAFTIRELVMGKNPNQRRSDYPALEAHLSRLARDSEVLRSVAAWWQWWEDGNDLLRSMGFHGKVSGDVAAGPLDTRRETYGPAYARVIPDLGATFVPLSNAGVEESIKSKIKPLFVKRTSFTSIERTNRLTDLAVAASRHALDDETAIARLLREDAYEHAGRTTEPRAIADPADLDRGVRYRSLRDKTLSGRVARDRGLL